MKKFTMLFAALALAGCGKSQTPSDPLHAAAVQTCKAVIEARAINKKTVDYRSVEVKPLGTGLNVAINFSAKNEIGIASTMVANCQTTADGKTMTAIAVKS